MIDTHVPTSVETNYKPSSVAFSHKDYILLSRIWTLDTKMKSKLHYNRLYLEEVSRFVDELYYPSDEDFEDGVDCNDYLELPWKEESLLYKVYYFFCSRDYLLYLAKVNPHQKIAIFLRGNYANNFFACLVRVISDETLEKWEEEGKKIPSLVESYFASGN